MSSSYRRWGADVAGFKYVGADESEDGDANDLLTKGDIDAEFTGAAVNQLTTQAAINSAVAGHANQAAVATALSAYATSAYLTTGNLYVLSVQSVAGQVAAGTYVLSFGGLTTAPIAPFAPSTVVRHALAALATIANVTVTGLDPYVISVNPVATSVLGIDPTNLTNATATLTAGPLGSLISDSEVGAPGGVAPLNSSGIIPAKFVPSLGAGYCLGPFGATATFNVANAGSVPMKIADWNIGPPGTSFVPMVFMNVMASAINGGRPVIEVRMSQGQQPYVNQTPVARGVGRNNWNDLQSIGVLPVPAANGASGGSGQLPTYNLWLSAWLYDANGQGVSVQTDGIMSTAAYLIRYRQ